MMIVSDMLSVGDELMSMLTLILGRGPQAVLGPGLQLVFMAWLTMAGGVIAASSICV